MLTTAAGDLEVAIPKLRTGSFFPSLLERRRRVDQALFAVVMEAYVTGTSVRKVDDLVHASGAGSGISKSEVSRICADLDEVVAAFTDRDLSEVAFPYVFLDATYCKVIPKSRFERLFAFEGERPSLIAVTSRSFAATCRTIRRS